MFHCIYCIGRCYPEWLIYSCWVDFDDEQLVVTGQCSQLKYFPQLKSKSNTQVIKTDKERWHLPGFADNVCLLPFGGRKRTDGCLVRYWVPWDTKSLKRGPQFSTGLSFGVSHANWVLGWYLECSNEIWQLHAQAFRFCSLCLDRQPSTKGGVKSMMQHVQQCVLLPQYCGSYQVRENNPLCCVVVSGFLLLTCTAWPN